MDVFLNQQSAACAADMALVEEDSVDYAFNGLVNWSIVKDDVGGFAAKFQG